MPHKERLLNVVRALEESPNPDQFTMELFGLPAEAEHGCGTPACAAGHYAARTDLQSAFVLTSEGDLFVINEDGSCHSRVWTGFRDHFRLDYGQVSELFEAPNAGNCECDIEDPTAHYLTAHYLKHASGCPVRGGCDGAQTTAEAAAYIRDFIKRNCEETGT